MANVRKRPRYNVVSIRVSDEEKTALDEMTRGSGQTISDLMREAMQRYAPMLEARASQS